ncbi:MAG: DUF1937 family protein [Acetobacteraceae bacterium]|nr:DUF1937 family protein [Acetobacteraceae bacterium]
MTASAYLALPYTNYHLGKPQAEAWARTVSAELIGLGIPTFAPVAYFPSLAERSGVAEDDWEFWMRMCAPFMDAAGCLIIWKSPGWRASKGIAEEIRAFSAARKPIFEIRASFPIMVPAEVFEWLSSMRV